MNRAFRIAAVVLGMTAPGLSALAQTTTHFSSAQNMRRSDSAMTAALKKIEASGEILGFPEMVKYEPVKLLPANTPNSKVAGALRKIAAAGKKLALPQLLTTKPHSAPRLPLKNGDSVGPCFGTDLDNVASMKPLALEVAAAMSQSLLSGQPLSEELQLRASQLSHADQRAAFDINDHGTHVFVSATQGPAQVKLTLQGLRNACIATAPHLQ